jgi:hypothetical protein
MPEILFLSASGAPSTVGLRGSSPELRVEGLTTVAEATAALFWRNSTGCARHVTVVRVGLDLPLLRDARSRRV